MIARTSIATTRIRDSSTVSVFFWMSAGKSRTVSVSAAT